MHRIEIIHRRVNGLRSVKAANDLLKQALDNYSADIAPIGAGLLPP